MPLRIWHIFGLSHLCVCMWLGEGQQKRPLIELWRQRNLCFCQACISFPPSRHSPLMAQAFLISYTCSKTKDKVSWWYFLPFEWNPPILYSIGPTNHICILSLFALIWNERCFSYSGSLGEVYMMCLAHRRSWQMVLWSQSLRICVRKGEQQLNKGISIY